MITTLKLISFFTLGVVLIEISVFNPQRQRVLVYRRSLKSLESAGEDVVRSQYLAEDDSRNDKKSRCQIWRTSKEILNKNLKTKIISNNEKFIIPILYNGPNNQLMGVRQAAYVSVILNRTLVLPTFRKHLTEDGGNLTEVDANQRLDVEKLSNVVSTIGGDKISEICQGAVGAVILARRIEPWTFDLLEKTEQEFGLKILRKNAHGKIDPKNPLLAPSVSPLKGFKVEADAAIIRRTYATDAKCVIYAFPFREIIQPYDQYCGVKKSNEDYPLQDERGIADMVYYNTKPPVYIKEISTEFINDVIREPYLAIHWRFDKKDFYKFMCTVNGNRQTAKGRINPSVAKLCSKVSSVSPETLSQSIKTFLQLLNSQIGEEITTIYLASPRESIEDFLNVLEKKLKRSGIKVYSSQDVILFLQSYQQSCESVNRSLSDLLSIVEMEICTKSKVFMRSSYSSWSDNVVLSRKLEPESRKYCRLDRPVLTKF